MVVTAGTSEGIELALSALVDHGDEVLVPLPTYPLYTAVIAKLGARAVYYRTQASGGWIPDFDHLGGLVTPATRALVVIDPNNPTGASYPMPVRRQLIDFAERHGLPMLADEVYGDLGYDGPVAPIGSLQRDAAIISFSSLSKAYLAPGWRTGWIAVGASPRLDEVATAIKKLADGRLCSAVPMQYAVAAALTGDRSHQGVVSRGAQGAREPDGGTLARNARGHVHDAERCVLCDAADYAAARPDRRRLRARAVASDRRPVRVRIRLWPSGNGGISSNCISRLTGGTAARSTRLMAEFTAEYLR